ncbi:MAG: hypothetical protein K0R54_530 [Clostridiaceae bacterium]|jgi:hypothetical protein|nr:hypothetical protein [Clostridiaceae bacterium]
MNLSEFKQLSEKEKVDLVNQRLLELKECGRTIKEFRSETLNFTYPTAMKMLMELGFAKDKDIFTKDVKLTEEEISRLKTLANSYEYYMKHKQFQPEVTKRSDDVITTTSARVYKKVWKRWQCFCQEWSIFNAIDMMASALEEYMDKYGFEDYRTLIIQKKIKDNK